MKPLHTSYSNLGQWTTVQSSDKNSLSVVYNFRGALIAASMISTLCVVLSSFAYLHVSGEARVLFLVIGIGTALLVSGIICATAFDEKGRGAILTYDRLADTLTIRDFGETVVGARKKVLFSDEAYPDTDGGKYELNLVINGERRKFLSHTCSNGFDSILRFAEMIDFEVVRHEEKKA